MPSAARFQGAFSYEDLVAAWLDCRRAKRTTAAAQAFELDIEANLAALYQALTAGTYQPGRSICFVINRPKNREVWAAGFADRVVHHLLYRAIGPRFERAFIADTCACIKGRGTLYAARRLEAKVRSITRNWTRPAFYLKLDLANFFPASTSTACPHVWTRRSQSLSGATSRTASSSTIRAPASTCAGPPPSSP